MATDWQASAIEQAELISSRLRELLSTGEGYIRSEFGVELGLTPELYPSWVILSTAVVGLLVLLVLSWAAVCGGLFGGKKLGAPVTQDSGDSLKAQLNKIVKPEAQNKKTKKKSTEKKAQYNGRTVPEPQEEVREEITKPSPEIKTEVKKTKKKDKPEVKPAKKVSARDGKEPDDGTWETKVSNREKRQQKRKEKGPDGSGSLEGVEVPHRQVEQPPLTAPVNRKNREPLHLRTGKGDSITTPVSTSWREEPSVNGGGWPDISMKLPTHICPSDGEKWPAIPKGPRHLNSEPTWRQGTEGSWSGVDGRMKTELNTLPSVLGLKTTEHITHPASELQWECPSPSDEWSGLNGIAAADPSSDWNAPTEPWGNYEGPPVGEAPGPPPQDPVPNHPQGEQGSDDDKEDDSAGGAARPKKKKKKKKKRAEEGVGTGQVTSDSMTVTPVESPALPPAGTKQSQPSSQKISDPSFDAPKPSQKKKVRKETGS
ncbi:metadherin a isoform X1 [Salvelinus alpinus]|uniref:metadherin a isoform X1 n=1 Tax=Salvelinus alpinus TaxID=8036 RepID=UPI0039FD173A